MVILYTKWVSQKSVGDCNNPNDLECNGAVWRFTYTNGHIEDICRDCGYTVSMCQTCGKKESINDYYGECLDCLNEYANDPVRLMNEMKDDFD